MIVENFDISVMVATPLNLEYSAIHLIPKKNEEHIMSEKFHPTVKYAFQFQPRLQATEKQPGN